MLLKGLSVGKNDKHNLNHFKKDETQDEIVIKINQMTDN